MCPEKHQHEIPTVGHRAAVHVVCGAGSDTGERQHTEAVRSSFSKGSGVQLRRIQVEKIYGRRGYFPRRSVWTHLYFPF